MLQEKAEIHRRWSFGHIVIENGKRAEAVIDLLEKMINNNLQPVVHNNIETMAQIRRA